MIAGNHLAFGLDGTLPAGSTRVIASTELFDHCNMTVSPGAPQADVARFGELLLAMRWDDPEVRPLLELEGLRQWLPGRTSGYVRLDQAVDEEGFYDANGNILRADYRY
jgi:ABC-type phosphate/phosphonate transport system substrate-binding protein